MKNIGKILLIEDNRGDVRLLQVMLNETGIPHDSLMVFDRLDNALSIEINENDISLILLDLTLPDSDGIETVRKVRQKFHESVIVVLTGVADEYIALDALREGAQDYLIKGESTSKELDKVIRFSIERQNIITRLNQSNEELNIAKEELQTLAMHLQRVREEERTMIAREIHDELGQQLTGLKMDVAWLKRRIVMVEPEIKNKISEMNTMIDETVKSIRRIAYQLRPGILDDLGLNAALEWQSMEFQKRTGINCTFVSGINDSSLTVDAATSIFRIYQEALTNIVRHSQATDVISKMFTDSNNYILDIRDNGKGFVPQTVNNKKTLGLLGMKERSKMIGGSLEIESEPDKGTSVQLRVPIS